MPESTMDSGAGREVKGEAREVAGEAKAAAEQAKRQASERFSRQKSSATRHIKGVARALRTTADQVEPDQEFIARYARRAADGVERIGDALERKEPSELMRDVERICRERPLLVGAAAVVAGFLGARMARVSVASQREPGGVELSGAGFEEQDRAELEMKQAEGGI